MFPSLGEHGFVEGYWPDSTYVEHGSLDRFGKLLLPERLNAPKALALSSPNVLRLWRSKGKEFSQLALPPRDAWAVYEAGGFTLVVDGIDQWIPSLRSYLDSIEQELNTPQLVTSCNAYISPDGLGSSAHFDPQEVFLVQISGSKTWYRAENLDIPFPTSGYFGEPELAADLNSLCGEISPPVFDEKRAVTLMPGSVMYLPRGHWHQSRAGGESFALTLTFASATWKDMLLGCIAKTLHADQRWRRPAHVVPRSGARSGLSGEAENAAMSVVQEWIDCKPSRLRFSRVSGIKFERVEEIASGRLLVVVGAAGKIENLLFECNDAPISMLQWLCESPCNFGLSQMLAALPDSTCDSCLSLLMPLVDRGLFTCNNS